MPENIRFAGLKAEIQIRSLLQHAWAEIEHGLGYKPESVPDEHIRRFSRLAGMFELADEEFVRLRDGLLQHEQIVREEIDASPREVVIDNVSLTAFLEQDQTVQVLDQRIASAVGGTIYTGHPYYQDTSHISQLVEQLQWVGVSNVGELKEQLESHKAEIIPFAKELLSVRLRAESIRTLLSALA